MQVALHILGIIGFERPVVGLMEQDDDGHHFAGIHLGRAQALSLTRRQQGTLPVRRELLPEIVHGTKEFEYTHGRNLLGIDTGFLLCSILPGKVPYPELTLNNLAFQIFFTICFYCSESSTGVAKVIAASANRLSGAFFLS